MWFLAGLLALVAIYFGRSSGRGWLQVLGAVGLVLACAGAFSSWPPL